jgi:pre-mRNA-splicing factor SPF27
MPLITTVHESLPYIDVEPTPSNRAAALSLINAEIPQNTNSHPNLPPLANCQFSSLIESEISRIEAKLPLNAIDLSRYEALEPPSTSPHSDEDHPETLRKWREALSQAYTSHTYLAGRQTNLMLLEQFGKNSWLIGNSQLEHVLRDLESELENRKEEIDIVVIERKNAQETMGAEVKGLEEVWKRGVGRVLETEVAAESIRREILERRRAGAS